MTGEREAIVARLQQRLLAEAGPAGWAYYSGKSSRVEPTCWALLALSGAPGSRSDDSNGLEQRHLAYLAGIQRASGLLVETDDALANLSSNGLALATLASLETPGAHALRGRLLSGVVAVKGVRLPRTAGPQDDQLQGWPWVKDTFSWVEPTSWCLLALKKSSSRESNTATPPRIAEAEQLLLNRVCSAGGWNYGNANALGQDPRPYVPTTAVGLLAMQDRRAEPPIQRCSRWLSDDRLSEPATISLALTAMALGIHGIAVDDVEARLVEAVSQSEKSGHLLAIAMAAYALSAERNNLEALRVQA